MMKHSFLVFILISVLVSSCGSKKEIEELTERNAQLTKQISELQQDNQKLKEDFQKLMQSQGQLQFLAKKLKGIKARLVTTYGNIELEFFPEKAPLHCFNFIARAESGFYNNTQFHRVIPGFMIQGGDPNSRDNNPNDDGMGGPMVNIPHEFNDIKHEPGILSMARTPNVAAGAGSQFFIMHGTNANLDGQYTAFGKVTRGMDVVNEIANARTFGSQNRAQKDHPVKPIRIKKIEIFR